MLYLLHGENAFLAKERLDKIIAAFKKKYSEDSVRIISGDRTTISQVMSEASSLSMFSTNKLVVVKNFSENKESKLFSEKIAGVNTKELNICFLETVALDKRSSFYKLLKENGKIEEFKNLSGRQLNKWIAGEFKKHGKDISDANVGILFERVGSEMWRLSGEIEKLCLYSQGRGISESDILEIVSESAEVEIWKFIDALSARNRKLAIELFEKLLRQGGEPHYVISMMIWQFRKLLLVAYLLDQNKSIPEITRKLKLHPFVAKKLVAGAKRISFERLKAMYDKLVEIDFSIKAKDLDPVFAISVLLSTI